MKKTIFFSLQLLLFFLGFKISYAQVKKENNNIITTGIGVQFTGKGDLDGSNFNLGYKRYIKNKYFVSTAYQKYDYKLFLETRTRLRSTYSFQALFGRSFGRKNIFDLSIGPYYSINKNRVINGLNTISYIGISQNRTLIIKENTSFGYKENSIGYTLNLRYLIKINQNLKLGPVFQFENDNIDSTVSSLRIGFEFGI
jgi:hypothetical protein